MKYNYSKKHLVESLGYNVKFKNTYGDTPQNIKLTEKQFKRLMETYMDFEEEMHKDLHELNFGDDGGLNLPSDVDMSTEDFNEEYDMTDDGYLRDEFDGRDSEVVGVYSDINKQRYGGKRMPGEGFYGEFNGFVSETKNLSPRQKQRLLSEAKRELRRRELQEQRLLSEAKRELRRRELQEQSYPNFDFDKKETSGVLKPTKSEGKEWSKCVVYNSKAKVSKDKNSGRSIYIIDGIYFYVDGTARYYDRSTGKIDTYNYICSGEDTVLTHPKTKKKLVVKQGKSKKADTVQDVIKISPKEGVYVFDVSNLDNVDFEGQGKNCVIDISLTNNKDADGKGFVMFSKDGGVLLSPNNKYEKDFNYIYYSDGSFAEQKEMTMGVEKKDKVGSWACKAGKITRQYYDEYEEPIVKKQGKKKISKNLKRGSRGEEVKQMQLLLGRILGVDGVTMSAIGCKNNYDYTTCDGIFGKNTDKYVRQFQEKEGLVVDGIVGPKTFAKLVELNPKTELTTDDTKFTDDEELVLESKLDVHDMMKRMNLL